VTVPTKQSVSLRRRRQVLTLLVLGCLLLLGSAAVLTPQRAQATMLSGGRSAGASVLGLRERRTK